MIENLRIIEEKLSKILPEKRFIHTQGVRYIAASMAMRYGVALEKAQLAGLLHDCAKYLSDSELLDMCKQRRIFVSYLACKND